MQQANHTKVRPHPSVTPLTVPVVPSSSYAGDWWLQTRSTAIPERLRSDTPPKRRPSKKETLFALFGSSLPRSDSSDYDQYEEAVKDDEEEDRPAELPSSPAAMFLSGFTSPGSSVRSDSMSTHSPIGRPRLNSLPLNEVVGGYRLGPVIGHGAFSSVRRATSEAPGSNAVAAVKIILKDDHRPGASEAHVRLANEIKIWSQLSHEHVLPLFHSVDTPDATYLFTLLCPAGTLLDIINSHKADGLDGVGMDDAGMLFRQIVRGLKYLHEVMRLVHGDIKLENILVDEEGGCRIADFGLARWMSEDEHHEDGQPETAPSHASHGNMLDRSVHLSLVRPRGRHARVPSRLSASQSDNVDISSGGSRSAQPQYYFAPGSLPYAAPELLMPIKTSQIPPPNPAQDIWALGCVLYALLFGKLPFNDPFEPRLQMKILAGVWRLPADYRSFLPSPGSRKRSSSGSRSRSSRQHSRTRATTTRNRSTSRSQKSPSTTSFASFTPSLKPRMRSRSRGRPTTHHALPQQPQKSIGRVAENVLHGCLSKATADRWSISMIDEVGWGVGWDLDVDEAGEEYEEVESPGASSGSASTSTNSSADPDRVEDPYGNRLYITPSVPGSVTEQNKLYSATLDLVTSSPDVHQPHSDLVEVLPDLKEAFLEGTLQSKPAPTFTSTTMTEDEQQQQQEAAEKRSRSRGKRGKNSRSSSLAVSHLTPSPPISNAASPSSESVDPFQAFREGYIPPSVKPLLASSSGPPSRSASRAPSTNPSRAASRERDAGHDWPRGRLPTSSATWRNPAAATNPMAALSTIESPRSIPPASDSAWHRPESSPSEPSSASPDDGRSFALKNDGRSRSSGAPESRPFGEFTNIPRVGQDGTVAATPRPFHGRQPSLPTVVIERPTTANAEYDRGRRSGDTQVLSMTDTTQL